MNESLTPTATSPPTDERRFQDGEAEPAVDGQGATDYRYDDAETTVLPPTDQFDTVVMEDTAGHSAETNQQPPAQESRWDRFKRGFWKHMYEAPMDMGPMGPIEQPAVPFDEWYAEKQEAPSRIGRMADRVAAKTEELASQAAEKTGELTAFVDYIGNVALIETAYYAGNVADEVRYQVESAKNTAAKKAKQVATGAGKFTRKADNAGNTALENAAIKAAAVGERSGKTGRKARYLGGLALDRLVSLQAQLRERMKMKHPTQRPDDRSPSSETWDWNDDWRWLE